MQNEPNKSTAQKNKIQTYIGIGVGIVSMFLLQEFFFRPPILDKQLMMASNEFNKSLPMMVDSETRLDHVIGMPNKTFQYYYTLVNRVRDSIDIVKLEEAVKPDILNSVRTNPDLKKIRENNVIMSYSYNDKNGVFLFKFSFKPEEYK